MQSRILFDYVLFGYCHYAIYATGNSDLMPRLTILALPVAWLT